MNMTSRALIPLTVSVALLAACARPAPSAPPTTPTAVPAAAVKTAPVQRTDLASVITYSGDVKAKANLTVVPKASGRVEKLNVDVGSVVKAGDVIAELDKDTATLTVKQNEAALAAAKAKLQTMQNGARQENVEQANANARAAQARTQSLLAAARPENVTQAQVQADNARQNAAKLEQGRDQQIAQADAAVANAQAALDALQKGPTPEKIQAQKIAIDQAQKNLEAAQTAREGICRFHGPLCDNARANVLSAEAALRQAQQQLTIMTSPPTAEQLAQAQAALDQARQQAQIARRPASQYDLAAAAAQVAAADAGVAAAQRPVVPGDIAAAQAQADAAQAGAQLAAQPYTKEDIAAQQAVVDQAQAALDAAKSALKDLTITAPVDGVVSDKLIVVGAVASPATPIVNIVSPDNEIAVNVEESTLKNVKAGQAAQITIAAFPGQVFNGKVTVVAPTVDPKSRTAVVKVEPDAAARGKLRAGMFAQVGIVTDQKSGVLAIPRSALLSGPDQAVMVVDNGTLKRVPVQTGIRGADKVEITSGLNEGDKVALDATDLREGDRVALASAG